MDNCKNCESCSCDAGGARPLDPEAMVSAFARVLVRHEVKRRTIRFANVLAKDGFFDPIPHGQSVVIDIDLGVLRVEIRNPSLADWFRQAQAAGMFRPEFWPEFEPA